MNRIPIGLPAASDAHVEAMINAANAVRAIRHHVLRGSAETSPIAGVVRTSTPQGDASFTSSADGLTMAYEPRGATDDGFAPTRVVLARRHLPGCAVWDASPDDLHRAFVDAVGPLFAEGTIASHEQPDGASFSVIEAAADGRRTEIERLVEDLSLGTDAAASGFWTVRRTWPGFGLPGSVHPVAEDGAPFSLPAEDDPSDAMRHARARILLLRRWVGELAPAAMAVVDPDGAVVLMPLSMTREAPADAPAARRASVAAFHRLAAMASDEGR